MRYHQLIEAQLKYKSNKGNISEFYIGAALVAKFINGIDKVTVEDVTAVVSPLKNRRTNFNKSYTGKNGDTIIFQNVIRNPTNKKDVRAYEFNMSAMKKEIEGAIAFANSDFVVNKTAQDVERDGTPDEIIVRGVGEEDQSGTKADIILVYNGKEIRKWSVKTGSDIIGQGSAGNFDSVQSFFKELGISVTSNPQYNTKPEEHIVNVMRDVANQLQRELRGDNLQAELGVVQSIQSFINQHATKKDPELYIVNVGKGKFTVQDLKLAAENLKEINLYATAYDERLDGQPARPSVVVHEFQNAGNFLVKIRYTFEASNNRHRMFVETGPLFKSITNVT